MRLPEHYSVLLSNKPNDNITIVSVIPVTISEFEYSSATMIYRVTEAAEPGFNSMLLVRFYRSIAKRSGSIIREVVTDGERFWIVIINKNSMILLSACSTAATAMAPSKQQIYDHLVC